jgi:hypothetical protein
VGAVVDVQVERGRLRVGLVFRRKGVDNRMVRQLGLGLNGNAVVPEVLVFAPEVLALIRFGKVPGGSFCVGVFVFPVEFHTQ